MGKLSKLSGVLSLFCLLALLLVACTPPWEYGMRLVATVDEPKDGSTVNTPQVTVSGTTSKSAEVKVNDAIVSARGSKFSTTVTLKEGQNTIKIEAKSVEPAETASKMVTVTYAR